MKKNVFYLLILAVLAVGFVSCSDDKDTTLEDRTILYGDYVGSLKVVADNSKTLKDTAEYKVNVSRNSSDQNILDVRLGDSNTDVDATTVKASGFIDEDTYARFSLSQITNNNILAAEVPQFLKDYAQFEVVKATWNLNCSGGAKFVKNTKVLTFEYTGTLILYGSGVTKTEVPVKYTYSLTKK
jgi:hypothetical protein